MNWGCLKLLLHPCSSLCHLRNSESSQFSSFKVERDVTHECPLSSDRCLFAACHLPVLCWKNGVLEWSDLRFIRLTCELFYSARPSYPGVPVLVQTLVLPSLRVSSAFLLLSSSSSPLCSVHCPGLLVMFCEVSFNTLLFHSIQWRLYGKNVLCSFFFLLRSRSHTYCVFVWGDLLVLRRLCFQWDQLYVTLLWGFGIWIGRTTETSWSQSHFAVFLRRRALLYVLSVVIASWRNSKSSNLRLETALDVCGQ